MPGPTAWQQQAWTLSAGVQSITTTNETVIATLSGITTRQAGTPILVSGFAQFNVQAATTATTLRIRSGGLTGSVLQSVTGQFAGTAAATSADQLSLVTADNPAGEYAGQTYVLTIQATAAAANWNVTDAALQILY